MASLSTVHGNPNELSRAELTPPTICTINFDGSVATINDIYEDFGSSSEEDGSITDYFIVSSGEVGTCNYLHSYVHTLDAKENIFSPTEMEDLKKRELALIERNDRGYYRCKLKYSILYDEITAAYAPYITK